MDLFFIILCAYLAGVLVNYLIDVLPVHMHLVSVSCRVCQIPYPFLTYFLFKECPSCKSTRPLRSYLISLAIIIVSIALWFIPPVRLGFLLSISVFIYLLIISVIDIEHRLVLSSLSAIGGILFFGIGLYLHGFIPTLLGGIVGFFVMYLLYWLGFAFSKIYGKYRRIADMEPGMGKGDISVSAIIGFVLGWPGVTAGILLGIVLGGVASVIVILMYIIKKSYKPNIGLPYVPFLAISTLILLFK